MAGAKPKYNFGTASFTPQFANDIDKALYITAQAKPSPKDKEYRQFLQDNGFTLAQIQIYGKGVRDYLKGKAQALINSGQNGGFIPVDYMREINPDTYKTITGAKPLPAAPTPVAPTPAPKPAPKAKPPAGSAPIIPPTQNLPPPTPLVTPTPGLTPKPARIDVSPLSEKELNTAVPGIVDVARTLIQGLFPGTHFELQSTTIPGAYGRAETAIGYRPPGVPQYIINHDGFPIIAKEALDMFDLVIIDEAAVYRNPSTRRFKQFYRWLQVQPHMNLWLMTGTPTPNEPTDAWALAKLVNSPHMSKSYTGFREQVMMKMGQWKFVPRPESVDVVKHVLQPSIRFTREECLDLPDTVTQTRKVPLTPEQAKHFKQMVKQLVTEVAGGTITAVNEAVKAQKLIQIALGVAYGENGELLELDCGPRISAVKEVIEEAGEKVILFVPLTGTLRMLERELSKDWTVGVVNGEVSAGKRNKIFDDFQKQSDPRVLIAHPGTMAHGLTLTSASTIIWYGPINSNEIYVQANGRIERIGKRNVSNVIHIAATDLEHKMYERLRNKQKLQGLLLDLIQQLTQR